MGLFPDVYDEPFHSLNHSLNKSLGKDQNTTNDFKVSNILNQKTESVYKSYQATDQVYNLLNPGTTFSLGISHDF
jgi:hypothetical protein